MRPFIAFFLLVAVNLLWMTHATSGLTPLGVLVNLAVATLATAVYSRMKKPGKSIS